MAEFSLNVESADKQLSGIGVIWIQAYFLSLPPPSKLCFAGVCLFVCLSVC